MKASIAILQIGLSLLLMAGSSPVEAETLRVGKGRKIVEGLKAAQEGDQILVEEGVYRERILIDKRVALRAVGKVILDGGGQGNIVEIKAPGVVFEGFSLRGSGRSSHELRNEIRRPPYNCLSLSRKL